MKVMFLVNIPSPYRVAFFNELGKKCDLTVLYERRSASDRNEKWVADKSTNFKEVYLKGKKIGKDRAFNADVRRFLKKNLFDIVVIGGYSTPTGMFAIEYCRLMKIPFILNADGGLISSDGKIKYKMKKHFIGSASAWLSTGQKTTEYLVHYGAEKDKIYTYPFTSIEQKSMLADPISPKEKSSLKKKLKLEDKPTVISVGQFIHRKGFDTLIESWTRLDKDYNLLIIGGGEKEQELNEQIQKLDLKNVQLLNFVEPGQLIGYYKASDLFVLPTREDVWGLVINEAMAYGLPVITTNKCVAGLELVENEQNGYIIPVNNSKFISESIQKVLNNDSLCELMMKNNLEKIKEYTIEEMAKEHLEIFKTINYKKEFDNYYIYE